MPKRDPDDCEEEADRPHDEEPGQHVGEQVPLPGVMAPDDPERFAQLSERALRIPEGENAGEREMRIGVRRIEVRRGPEKAGRLGSVAGLEGGQRLAVSRLGRSERADLARVPHLLQLLLHGIGAGIGGDGGGERGTDRSERRERDSRRHRRPNERSHPRAPWFQGLDSRHCRNLGSRAGGVKGNVPRGMLSSLASRGRGPFPFEWRSKHGRHRDPHRGASGKNRRRSPDPGMALQPPLEREAGVSPRARRKRNGAVRRGERGASRSGLREVRRGDAGILGAGHRDRARGQACPERRGALPSRSRSGGSERGFSDHAEGTRTFLPPGPAPPLDPLAAPGRDPQGATLPRPGVP